MILIINLIKWLIDLFKRPLRIHLANSRRSWNSSPSASPSTPRPRSSSTKCSTASGPPKLSVAADVPPEASGTTTSSRVKTIVQEMLKNKEFKATTKCISNRSQSCSSRWRPPRIKSQSHLRTKALGSWPIILARSAVTMAPRLLRPPWVKITRTNGNRFYCKIRKSHKLHRHQCGRCAPKWRKHTIESLIAYSSRRNHSGWYEVSSSRGKEIGKTYASPRYHRPLFLYQAPKVWSSHQLVKLLRCLLLSSSNSSNHRRKQVKLIKSFKSVARSCSIRSGSSTT